MHRLAAGGAPVSILFAGYEEANLGCVAPVMAALARRGVTPLFLPGTDFKPHRGLRTATAPAGVAAPSPLVALPASQRAAARRHGVALLRRARNWARHLPLSEQPAAAALRRLLEPPAMDAIAAAYAQLAAAAAEIARREPARLVVLSEDSDYLRGRLLARVFAAEGRRVVCLSPWYYAAFASYPMVGRRRADHYLVGSDAQARRLRAGGVAADAVTVVGHPELDAVASLPPAPPGGVLYALQGLPWEAEIAADLVAWTRRRRDARLVIRAHPTLPRPAWLRRLGRGHGVVVAPAAANVSDLLAAAQCVVAQTSRMLWEASLAGRSVVVPHYDATPLPIAVPAGDRRAVVATSGAALQRRLDAALDGRGRGLDRDVIAPHHPRATARATAALLALLRAG